MPTLDSAPSYPAQAGIQRGRVAGFLRSAGNCPKDKGGTPHDILKINNKPHAMIPLITQHSDDIAEICRRHHVKRLDLFGSATAAGDFNAEKSDLDFLVDFGDAPLKPWYGNHFDLKEDLENLFQRTVDLIDYTAIKNPYFRKSVDETREQIYAAQP